MSLDLAGRVFADMWCALNSLCLLLWDFYCSFGGLTRYQNTRFLNDHLIMVVQEP
jgi:hypothetical protein